MKTETLINLIRPALTQDQEMKMDCLVKTGHTFHSLFHDGSVELLSPAPEKAPVYVERNGHAIKYQGGTKVAA